MLPFPQTKSKPPTDKPVSQAPVTMDFKADWLNSSNFSSENLRGLELVLQHSSKSSVENYEHYLSWKNLPQKV